MIGKNRQGRNEGQRYSRADMDMRGPQRRFESDTDAYNWDQAGSRRMQGYSDYSSFEGATDRPYYGGEEGRFPYGGSNDEYPHSRNSWNADERNYSGNWMRGEHFGKGPKGYRRADARILEEVCEMLTEHGEIDATEVEVDVKDGVVMLSGTVQNRRIKRMIEDMSENISGVKDVRNDLRVMAQGLSPQNSAEFARNSINDYSEESLTGSSLSSPRNSNKSMPRSSSSSKRTKSAGSSRRMNS